MIVCGSVCNVRCAQVLEENKHLDEGTARRLMRDLDFEDPSEVQALWVGLSAGMCILF